MIKRFIPILGIVFISLLFFWQFILKGLLPIPSDTIIGLYHPYRDLYANTNPNGIAYKNFLITDPVRQTFPWRNLSINDLKNLQIPSWNPNSFAGNPNIANQQSAVFYPLNLLFFLLPFNFSWSVLILLEPILGGIFMYLFLRNLKLDEYSSFFGAIVFSFSGFFVSWMEWGTIIHSALWLPLILLSIDKIKDSISVKKSLISWSVVFVFSMVVSLFAGHLQTFFYISIVALIYQLVNIYSDKNKKLLFTYLSLLVIFIVISLIQIIPTINFILQSARNSDLPNFNNDGWFIPWQHLIQFIVPDFFGNPTTLNYWGTWNYGELVGYVGIIPLIFSFYALLYKRNNKIFLFGSLFFISLIFALPTFVAKIPFIFHVPFVSSSQPTRLLFISDFCLSILSAFGFNLYMNEKRNKRLYPVVAILGVILLVIFGLVYFGNGMGISTVNLLTIKRNLIFPCIIFIVSGLSLFMKDLLNPKYKKYLFLFIILITIFDLFRFFSKFETFSKSEYLYPQTKTLNFLESNLGNNRFATNDERIMAPNFSIMYKLNTVEGYDPLYLQRYGEFISAVNRNKPDISSPFGFNRIVRVTNFNSNLINLLGIKYILSLDEMSNANFVKAFEEGQTKIYENKNVLPKAFFVTSTTSVTNKQDAINFLFNSQNLGSEAVVEDKIAPRTYSKGYAEIVNYKNNEVILKTKLQNEGFLVLTDSYYPTWHARIGNDMNKLHDTKIYRTDYNFRGILVPKGENFIVFKNSLL